MTPILPALSKGLCEITGLKANDECADPVLRTVDERLRETQKQK